MIAALFCALGCVAPQLPASAPVPTTPSAAIAPPRGWRAEGELCVRLERFETQQRLVVKGGRGAQAQFEIARAGASLSVNGELILENEVWIEPRDLDSGLSIAGAHYPGRLRVRVLSAASAGADAGLAVDDIVDLEQYIAGVVASEVQLIGAAPAELEAQAIASRSFALAQLTARGARSLEVRLYDTTRDQAFRGKFVPTQDPQSQAAARMLDQALQKTRGMILSEGGKILDARFHAACGGRTADAADVFPEAAQFQSLRSVECAGCLNAVEARSETPPLAVPAGARDLSWRTTLNAEQLDRLANSLEIGAHLLQLEPVRRDHGGRWLEVELRGTSGSRRLSFETLRKSLKDTAIGSNLVLATLPRSGQSIEGRLLLTGRGRGHGVGLCQNGCHAYALGGWSAAQILAHYYSSSALIDGR